MKISVCIPSVRSRTIAHAVESIRGQTFADWELIVIGQGRDADLERVVLTLASQDRRIHYLHLDERGVSRARNAGIRSARGDVLALTDDDCEAQPEWLAVIAGCFAAEPQVGVVGGAVVGGPPSRRGISRCPALTPDEALYDPSAHGRQAPPNWDWIGSNVAIRRELIERVGVFDEHLGAGAEFPAAEDTDYKLRLEALGVPMRSTPRAVVDHTFGRRYGVRAVLRSQRNYARGNGGLAAKLTLLGDPRGGEWLHEMAGLTPLGWRHPRRSAAALLRLRHFRRGYRDCLRAYTVDSVRGLLTPLGAASRLPGGADLNRR